MKVIRPLKISADEFFDYIEQGIASDLFSIHEDDPDYELEPLAAGLTYVKNADERYLRTEVKVLEYERGRIYRSRSSSYDDETTVTYEVEPTAEGIQVTFTQETRSVEEKRAKQNFLMRGFSEAIYLGQMGESLVSLQYKIIDEREGVKPKRTIEDMQRERNQRMVEQLAEKAKKREEKRNGPGK